jgi:hypothetical protein
MMPRELTMNAIEAAQKAPEGQPKIRFIAKNMKDFPGTRGNGIPSSVQLGAQTFLQQSRTA